MSDVVKLYNPANSGSLTPDQLKGLQSLSTAEIKELAAAYPNLTMNRAYLLIIDGTKEADKQLPALSTFENLYNLREKNGQRNFVAYSFRGVYKPIISSPVRAKRTEVVDLSDTELMVLPGFKAGKETIATEKVRVTKVKKIQ